MTAVDGRWLVGALGAAILVTTGSGARGAGRLGTITLHGVGAVASAHRYDLQFTAPGRVATIPVAVGDHVRAGDVLAVLDQTPARAQLASAKVTAREAATQLSAYIDGVHATAAAASARDRAAVDSASSELHTAEATARAQVAAAQAASVQAGAALTRATAALAGAEEQVQETDATLGAAQTSITVARAAVAADRVQLTAVRARTSADEKSQIQIQGVQADQEAALQSAQADYQDASAQGDTALAAAAKQRITAAQAALASLRTQATTIAQVLIDDQAAVTVAQETLQRDDGVLAEDESASATARAEQQQAIDALAATKENLAEVAAARSAAQAAATLAVAQARESKTASRSSVGSARATGKINAAESSATAAGALAQARTALTAARAQVNAARAALAATTLRAPGAGVIAAVNGEVGEIWGGSEPLVTVISESSHVTAAFDEVDVTRIRSGGAAAVTVAALDGRTFPAQVTRVDPLPAPPQPAAAPGDASTTTAPATPSYDVDLAIIGPASALRPGMTVSAEIAVNVAAG